MQSISVVFSTLHCEGYIADLRYRWLIASGSARWLNEILSAILKGTRHGQGGLEALPMIQRVTVCARFLKCKQNLDPVQGNLPFFIWFVLRFDSLLLPQAWVYLLFMLLGIFEVRF